MFDVVVLYVVLAAVFPLGRAAVQCSQPIFFTGVRMLLSGIVLLAGYYFYDKSSFKRYLNFRYLPTWLLLALFSIYLTNVLEFWGLQYLPAAKACFIYSLSPFFAALISYFLFAERMTFKKWLGLSVGFVGIIPLLFFQSPGEVSTGGISFLSWAELALLGAAISSVCGWVSMRRLVKFNSVPPVMANGMSMLIGSLFIIPSSMLLETWDPIPVSKVGPFIVLLILTSLASNIIGYNMYAILLKKYTATFMTLAGFMSPLFAALMAWLFLGETVGEAFWMSAIAVFAGLYIFYQEEMKQGYITSRR